MASDGVFAANASDGYKTFRGLQQSFVSSRLWIWWLKVANLPRVTIRDWQLLKTKLSSDLVV